uniref:(northern house mosquito) hypothetical protein n=1 Tax=Culex pipiens TaxID=7175 RepID=A0A8D8P698_CULPI
MFASSTRSFPEFSKQMLTRKAFYHDETSTIHPSTMAIYHFLCTFKVRFSTTDHRTNKNHLNKNPTINGTTINRLFALVCVFFWVYSKILDSFFFFTNTLGTFCCYLAAATVRLVQMCRLRRRYLDVLAHFELLFFSSLWL